MALSLVFPGLEWHGPYFCCGDLFLDYAGSPTSQPTRPVGSGESVCSRHRAVTQARRSSAPVSASPWVQASCPTCIPGSALASPFLGLPCSPVSPGSCPNYSAPTFGHPSRLLPGRQHHLLAFSVSPSALTSQVRLLLAASLPLRATLAPGFWPGRRALRSHSALLQGVGPRAGFKSEQGGHGTGRTKLRPKMEGS